MSHEVFHELLALRLYGELDAREETELEEHLRACVACRRFAAELGRGLGAARSSARAEPERSSEPALAPLVFARVARARRRAWWNAAAGFVLGAGLASAIAARAERPVAGEPVALRSPDDAPSAYARYRQSEPPPIAVTRGDLARLGEYLRR